MTSSWKRRRSNARLGRYRQGCFILRDGVTAAAVAGQELPSKIYRARSFETRQRSAPAFWRRSIMILKLISGEDAKTPFYAALSSPPCVPLRDRWQYLACGF